MKNKAIEKSEMDPNIFIKILVIFKSQKLFLNYLKIAQTNKKYVKNSKPQYKIP